MGDVSIFRDGGAIVYFSRVEPKAVKFYFARSKLRKQPFLPKMY